MIEFYVGSDIMQLRLILRATGIEECIFNQNLNVTKVIPEGLWFL